MKYEYGICVEIVMTTTCNASRPIDRKEWLTLTGVPYIIDILTSVGEI
jgi:hypothetical protein